MSKIYLYAIGNQLQLYYCHHMEAQIIIFKAQIEDLVEWTIENRYSLDDFLKMYPYVQYKIIQTAKRFKEKLLQIADSIARAIRRLGLHLNNNSQNEAINLLSSTKIHLQNISYIFIGLPTTKNYTLDQILNKLISLATLPSKDKQRCQESINNPKEKNLFQDNNLNQRIYTNKWQEKNVKQSRPTEEEKKNIIKLQLYDQMLNDLKKPQKSVNRISSEKINSRQKDESYQYQHGKFQNNNRQTNDRAQAKKRNFNYLKQYEEQIKTPEKRNTRVEPLFNTPKRYEAKKDSPRSTEQNSQRLREEEQKKEQQYDQQIQKIREKLDFINISKIRQRTDEDDQQLEWCLSNEQGKVPRGFSSDNSQEKSIKEGRNQQSFQDSLQLMKEEQKLNNTAHFGIKNLLDQNSINDFSFSHE